jgi:hypothetical protein
VFDTFYVAPAVVYEYLEAGAPWTLWFLGWAADYAQPYDYWAAYGAAQGEWSSTNSVDQVLTGAAYNSPSCTGAGAIDSFSTLYYWADQSSIPQDCQGVAYNVTLYWASYANHDTNIPQGVLIWNRVDAITAALNLYVNTEQAFAETFFAPWINPSSLDLNGIMGFPGGEGDWYTIQGNGVL